MPSPRDHIETHVFDPPAGGTVAAAETAILLLLTAAEHHLVGSPAATACTAAIRRKGEELLTAGGAGDVLDYMANRIHAAVPERLPSASGSSPPRGLGCWGGGLEHS